MGGCWKGPVSGAAEVMVMAVSNQRHATRPQTFASEQPLLLHRGIFLRVLRFRPSARRLITLGAIPAAHL